MATSKTRTSARQAAARQRIQQTDSPAGSAPPFETMAPGWIFNPGRSDERRMLEVMIEYLQDDPNLMDAEILCFVYKEWPKLTSSMKTKTTVMNVKKKLITMNVPYIHRTQDNDWGFWNNYTITGLFDIHSSPASLMRGNTNASPASKDS